jgi:methionyl-tRNA synthetase
LTGNTNSVGNTSSTRISSGLQPTESDPSEKGALAPGFSAPTKAERDLFASDVLRYFLLREIPFGQDGSFSFDALITRYNADLANGYGNLVSRTLSMIQRYLDGRIPVAPPGQTLSEMLADLDSQLTELLAGREIRQQYDFNDVRALVESLPSLTSNCLEIFDFSTALKTVAMMVSTADQMLTAIAPWKIDQGQVPGAGVVAQTLHVAAESIRIITALLYPILPYATARVWAQLGLGDIQLAARNGELNSLTWGGLKPGTKLGPLGPIFPRADKGLAHIMTDMENPTPVDTSTTDPAAAPRTSSFPELAAALPVGGSTALTTGPDPSKPAPEPSAAASPAPAEAAQITIDDFAKIELRVAQILVAERIPKADKLLRLEVDLGTVGKRQILSGIAEWYAPEDLIGRRIVVITNLAPRKMRGLESHGMLLAASHGENGKPVLATFGEDIALGSRLK